ncbi:MAG: PPC domain-containing DNA-binding protein [Patescibacteria group bacterium]
MSECEHNNDILIAKINKGKKIVDSIIGFCQENNITGAWVTGIGAVSKAKLAFYDLSKKSFSKKEIKNPLEIASLSGNIGLLDRKLVAHIHTVLSDKEMTTFAGHLEEATVAATCEIKLEIFDQPIIRKFDPDIGLNLIQIK